MAETRCWPDQEQWDLLYGEPEGTCLEMHGRLKGWWMVRGRSRSFMCHPDGRCDCYYHPEAKALTPCAHQRALKAHLESLPPKVPCPTCKGRGGTCPPCHSEGWVCPQKAEEYRVAWPLYQALKARFREELVQEEQGRIARQSITFCETQRLNPQPAPPATEPEEKRRAA